MADPLLAPKASSGEPREMRPQPLQLLREALESDPSLDAPAALRHVDRIAAEHLAPESHPETTGPQPALTEFGRAVHELVRARNAGCKRELRSRLLQGAVEVLCELYACVKQRAEEDTSRVQQGTEAGEEGVRGRMLADVGLAEAILRCVRWSLVIGL